MNKEASLKDGSCENAEWCAKQRAVPDAVAREWPRMKNDLQQYGVAGITVNGRNYILTGITETKEWEAKKFDTGYRLILKDDDNGEA